MSCYLPLGAWVVVVVVAGVADPEAELSEAAAAEDEAEADPDPAWALEDPAVALEPGVLGLKMQPEARPMQRQRRTVLMMWNFMLMLLSAQWQQQWSLYRNRGCIYHQLYVTYTYFISLHWSYD